MKNATHIIVVQNVHDHNPRVNEKCEVCKMSLERLVKSKPEHLYITISDDLLCENCFGNFRVERVAENIIQLSKNNEIVLYYDYAMCIPAEIRKKLRDAGIKYENGSDIPVESC